MKKYLLLFLVSILVLPLFGKITIGESVPLEYRNIVEEALVENTKVAQYQLSTLSGDNSLFGKRGVAAQRGDEHDKSTLILSTLSGDNTVR